MGDLIRSIDATTPCWFKILLAVCAVLYVVGFFIPPIGHVDPTAIQGMAVLIIGGLFGLIPYFLQSGNSLRVQHRDTSIEIGNKKDVE